MWTKVIIVLIGNAVFFSILALIWYFSKLMPRWEAKQIARQKELQARYKQATLAEKGEEE